MVIAEGGGVEGGGRGRTGISGGGTRGDGVVSAQPGVQMMCYGIMHPKPV